MLRVITDPLECQKLHTKLQRTLVEAASTEPEGIEFGVGGGERQARAVWYKENNWWYAYQGGVRGPWWNAFGLGNGVSFSSNRSIVVELNAPTAGIDRKVQGAFALDDANRECVVHRGRLGGGSEGVGMSFRDWYPPIAKRVMQDGDRTSDVILVGRLDDVDFAKAIRGFIGLARSYKRLAASTPQTPAPISDAAVREDESLVVQALYRPEFSGIATYVKTDREIIAEWHHGRIVHALRDEVKRLGLDAFNDDARDLYVTVDGRQVVLFEVKTDTKPQALYTAVGQLFWHSEPDCSRAVVVPAEVPASSVEQLRKLGVGCVLFRGPSENPTFEGLREALDAVLDTKQ